MRHITFLTILLIAFLNFTYSQHDSIINKDSIMTSKVAKGDKNDTVVITTTEPILIKSIETNKNSFWEFIKRIGAIIGIIGGLLGLIATGYVINDRWFNKPNVNSKIISFNCDDGEFEFKRGDEPSKMSFGLRYFLKLSINITSNTLNYNNLEIFVKYKNDDKEYQGEVFSPRNYSQWHLNGIPHKLKLPQENLLYYKTVLATDVTHLEYLTFIVFDTDGKFKDKLKGDDRIPLSIRLNFISSDKSFLRKGNNEYSSNPMRLDMGVEKYIWEDEIWIKE